MQGLPEKMQTRIIVKREVDSNNHEMMKFDQIYELTLMLSQTEKCCWKLEKPKSADTVKELMHQHKMLLKTDSIMM